MSLFGNKGMSARTLVKPNSIFERNTTSHPPVNGRHGCTSSRKCDQDKTDLGSEPGTDPGRTVGPSPISYANITVNSDPDLEGRWGQVTQNGFDSQSDAEHVAVTACRAVELEADR